MPRTTVVIIGAGQAGLAMSACLSAKGIEHVVLERGRIAERWRRHGWDSLRLLTPNWMTRLPGYRYDGDAPDEFMTTGELVTLLEQYAAAARAPVIDGTCVRVVDRWGTRFRVGTSRATWCAAAVVIATGYCERPAIPAPSRKLAPWIQQVTPAEYRNPGQLPGEGVLIVGASATGVQLAEELQRSGRQVTLAVGRHTRLPRTYRGRDILWWLDRLGVLAQDASTVHDIAASREQPSLQLVGRPDHASLDLRALRAIGVRMTGRLIDIERTHARFDDDLIATTAAADIKMADVLTRIDRFIAERAMTAPPAPAFEPTWRLSPPDIPHLDLRDERIATVIWATGYRRQYGWLQLPVLDVRGEIRHHGGLTPYPGLYVIGMNFQRRRHSSFIDGVGADARDLAAHIAGALHQRLIA
jgi:putative flavoprotein involved in K+ transport